MAWKGTRWQGLEDLQQDYCNCLAMVWWYIFTHMEYIDIFDISFFSRLLQLFGNGMMLFLRSTMNSLFFIIFMILQFSIQYSKSTVTLKVHYLLNKYICHTHFHWHGIYRYIRYFFFFFNQQRLEKIPENSIDKLSKEIIIIRTFEQFFSRLSPCWSLHRREDANWWSSRISFGSHDF